MISVKENLLNVRQKLAAIHLNEVQIMGVTKRQPVSRLLEAVSAGVKLFGVNYFQEGEGQISALEREGIQWHFIGHIQSRKSKSIAERYDAVQSLDRWEVAESLHLACARQGKSLPVLIEINIGHEATKSGVAVSDLDGFMRKLASLPSLVPTGFMVMPPPLDEAEQRRPFFREAKRLYQSFSTQFPFHVLSMGTSEDYLVAAQEGSNLIRLGTTLFGPRPTAPSMQSGHSLP